jgi:cytochrome P450
VTAPTMDEAAKVLADPLAYTDEPKLHAALTHLRVHAPISWVEVPSCRPFWAITKHADIMAIERDNTLFTNSPRPVLMTEEADEQQAAVGIQTLIHMDDPQHRVVRAIGADWFRPKAMRALKVRVDELAKRFVDNMMESGEQCDFVQVLSSLLKGVHDVQHVGTGSRDLRGGSGYLPLSITQTSRRFDACAAGADSRLIA